MPHFSQVFSSLKFGHNFVTSRPYLCPEMMSFRVSVNMSCKGFVKGFCFACSSLYLGTRTQFGSEGSHGMRLVDIFLISPVGDNLGLEAQYFQRFSQECHKRKYES